MVPEELEASALKKEVAVDPIASIFTVPTELADTLRPSLASKVDGKSRPRASDPAGLTFELSSSLSATDDASVDAGEPPLDVVHPISESPLEDVLSLSAVLEDEARDMGRTREGEE